ncbi:hypothetical protein N7468_008170 [Penicillium chermesinum]|uniref:Uncharacterized protein n=1 Tax=Penicillium chermesinum TaxID=63820 RepID=A0A9W9NRJ9_9EURO|nr:uncharacterized protein N7468_008170 [Penicillium chermesinum]KAJ5223628.1 hypothetical protein N7468_008170 [Penicillium chermesinum]KAJ6155544.1 hypothetical protein N7470_006110 [Penicillium chermesinum]
MVLLNSSTVSTFLSMGVVCICTLMLFFAGYVLQQQSVKNIQHALRPPQAHPAGQGSTFQSSEHQRVLSELNSRLAADLDQPRVEQRSLAGSKGNYAYLQLLSRPDPSDICSAVLFFKTLAKNESAIEDRLFMYPQEWDRMSSKQLGEDASTAMAILRAASIKYGIWLLPIDMTAAKGYSITNTKLLRLGQIQFMQYDSVLYVQTPGLILDTGKLDQVLLSQPLPLVHDKNRPDSYDNKAWTPSALRPERDADLPPVYLVTVNNVGFRNVQARTHVPNTSLPGFGNLITGPSGVDWDNESEGSELPGYVYFENDRDGRVKWAGNPLFGTWRAQQNEVCEGLVFDDM